MSKESHAETDVLIIGAGVAGCTAAIALAGSYSVVLVDKLAEPAERIGECLPPASRRILKKLGLLEGFGQQVFPAEGAQHLVNTGTQSWWGSERVQVVDHLRNPDGFGWHLDRRAFEAWLRASALQCGIDGCWPAQLSSANYKDGRWHVALTGGEGKNTITQHYTSRFVIDASGRQSHFAKQLGIRRQPFDQLVACWATLPGTEENKLSIISAAEKGWWYSAALPGGKRVVAFHTDPDLIARGGIKTAGQLIALAHDNLQIAALFERSAGDIDFRGTVAANSTRLQQVAGQQWAALGDAATSFDPLSSQGMFNAMAGAMQLTELIELTGILNDPGSEKAHLFESLYTSQVDQIWQHYLRHKDIFYGQEGRWKEALFWKRRQQM